MLSLLENVKKLRRLLHQNAELSNKEQQTAAIIEEQLQKCKPDKIITKIGGFGIAATFQGDESGPVLLLRAELDALPVVEKSSGGYCSLNPNVSHKCGHDGHMAILLGIAAELGRKRPPYGRVVLLFQPAEETGEGALRVLQDPLFQEIKIDYAFALHNLPGFPLGQIIIREGTFAATSVGMVIKLKGVSSHAAQPEKGQSPTQAFTQLIHCLSAAPNFYTPLSEAIKVTVIHASLGKIAFGTSPSDAVIMATLRAYDQKVMDHLIAKCEELTEGIAKAYKLTYKINFTEFFPATNNHQVATEMVKKAAVSGQISLAQSKSVFGWSEDFGHFTTQYTGALLGLGSGDNHLPLHHPDYDFPEDLLPIGIDFFKHLITTVLNKHNNITTN